MSKRSGRGRDWREDLKTVRDKVAPAPPPGAASRAGAAQPPVKKAAAKPPAKETAAELVREGPAAAPAPDPAAEAALFEEQEAQSGVQLLEAARRVAGLPHAGGPAAGEVAQEPRPEAPGAAKRAGDVRALPVKLDLHGQRLDDALANVRAFLRQHHELGGLHVVIVTGHGAHRGLDPVIRPEVEALLKQHPAVARHEPDTPGSFQVTLRRRKR